MVHPIRTILLFAGKFSLSGGGLQILLLFVRHEFNPEGHEMSISEGYESYVLWAWPLGD